MSHQFSYFLPARSGKKSLNSANNLFSEWEIWISLIILYVIVIKKSVKTHLKNLPTWALKDLFFLNWKDPFSFLMIKKKKSTKLFLRAFCLPAISRQHFLLLKNLAKIISSLLPEVFLLCLPKSWSDLCCLN